MNFSQTQCKLFHLTLIVYTPYLVNWPVTMKHGIQHHVINDLGDHKVRLEPLATLRAPLLL